MGGMTSGMGSRGGGGGGGLEEPSVCSPIPRVKREGRGRGVLSRGGIAGGLSDLELNYTHTK